MRKIKLLGSIVLVFATLFQVQAQEKKEQAPKPVSRCSTMEYMQKLIHDDPTLPEKWKQEGQRQYNAAMNARQGAAGREQAGEIIIPVVFHLVGAAADVNAIPDRDAYEQIEILNRDYYGQKAALYAGLFPQSIANTVGRVTSIKFVLARRTPAGALTTGVERRITAQTFTANTISNLKHTNTGGLDAWDNSQYLNVWCCNFTDGLLGIATFPFMTPANEQGVAIGLYTVGANTCRTYYPNYNQGATLSHEVGHYFYLFHTFNDTNGCNNLDFRTQAGAPLPAAALIDDTPPEFLDNASSTIFGNVSGIYNDGCAGPDGIAYGSFMNYYDDRSLFMFTEGHRQRVLATLNLYRTGFTSNTIGATPPGTVTDAYLVSMSPRGRCDTRMPMVPNTPITAVIRNFGTTPITSVAINVKIDALAAVTTNLPLALAVGNDTTITVGAAPTSVGNHTVIVYTTSPNGTTDNSVNNDSLTSYIYVQATPVTAPLTESFNTTPFPPANWIINNPQSATWTRSATAGFTTAGAATVQNYNYNGGGQLDELITPPVSYGTFDSSLLTFRVAYASYSNVTSDWDGLEVYVSGDGGKTYRQAYKKTGNNLSSVAGVVTTSFNPLLDQTKWRTESINLTPYIVSGQNLIVKFRNINAFGNNLYLDDVNISAAQLGRRDLTPIAFTNIPAFVCNGSTIPTPSVTVLNAGIDTVKTFAINYQVDNGAVVTVAATSNLARLQNASFTLGTLNLGSYSTGVHTLKVYTSLPNGLVDQNLRNDTLSTTFLVFGRQAAPLVEGFESRTFPPTGWAVVNQDALQTWQRTTIASRTDSSSAYVNNFNYAANGSRDGLYTPQVTYTGVDSVFLNFDLAATTKVYPGSTEIPLDTLEVLITTDCGTTLTSVYKKWGNNLQTVNDPNSSQPLQFIPANRNQWRNEQINLSIYASRSPIQVVFRNISNNGNNVFIDNINLNTKTLPAKLKEQGYLIYPVPFAANFYIQHYLTPTDLRGVAVYNSIGQRVWAKEYSSTGATSLMQIDLSRYANDVYTVVLRYTNRTVSQKIIKAK